MKRNAAFLLTLLLSVTLNATIINIPADYTGVQAGITASTNGDTVLVQPGIYNGSINFYGKQITLGSLYMITGDESYIETTTLTASGTQPVLKFNSGEDSTSIITGLTISGGNSYMGGGLYCYDLSSPKLTHTHITGNTGEYGGGVALQNGSNVILRHVEITNNTAYNGGGMYFVTSQPELSDMVISNNSADFGGGLYCNEFVGTISHTLFEGNSSDNGGALYIHFSNPTLSHLTIVNNTTGSMSAAIHTMDSYPTLINSIVANNSGDYAISGFQSDVTVLYSDFYGNSGGNCWTCNSQFGTITTTNFNGDDCDSNYNIFEDPLFVDPDGNFALTNGSPCINGGDPSTPNDPDGSVTDIGYLYFDNGFAGELGDLNQDGQRNVSDLIILVRIILDTIDASAFQLWASDVNEDSSVDIMDVVVLIDVILDN